MKERGIIPKMVVLLPLLLCTFLFILFVPSAHSDPIPSPPADVNLLYLLSENVIINVSPDNNGYVRGVYQISLGGETFAENTFENLIAEAQNDMTMVFPVPPNSENISVEVFGENIEWEWTDNEYPTELGNFQMIKWTFRIPENIITMENTFSSHGTGWGLVYSDIFNVVVEYAYSIPLEGGRHVILYSLGAAGSLGPPNYVGYGASAYIETKLPKEVKNVGVRLTKYEYSTDSLTSNISSDNETTMVTTTCILGSGTGDYVIEFPTSETSPLIYVGVALVIMVIIAAVVILKPF